MKSKMESQIMTGRGRPFGGTGFVWTKTLSLAAKPRCEYRHDRVTVLEVSSNIGSILLINCYMPYFDANNIIDQTNLYIDTLGFIDSVIKDNPFSKVILLGDMNCNVYQQNRFSDALNSFLTDKNLFCAYELMSSFSSNTSYTRCNVKQNSYSLLDYFFISQELIPFVDSIDILQSGFNLSDHLPIVLSLSIDVEINEIPNDSLPFLINWNKIDNDTRANYENVMDNCLQSVKIPDILHGCKSCNDPVHLINIEQYYNDLVHCIKVADLQLPRSKPKSGKSYWNDELSVLKNDSIVAFDLWKISNCPSSGPLYEAKKNARYRYKLCLRRFQKERDQSYVDSLNSNLLDESTYYGMHKFWKSYKFFNSSSVTQNGRINGFTNDGDIANCFANSFKNVYDTKDIPQSNRLRTEFSFMHQSYTNDHCNDSLNPYFLSWSKMTTLF